MDHNFLEIITGLVCGISFTILTFKMKKGAISPHLLTLTRILLVGMVIYFSVSLIDYLLNYANELR